MISDAQRPVGGAAEATCSHTWSLYSHGSSVLLVFSRYVFKRINIFADIFVDSAVDVVGGAAEGAAG